MTLRRGEERRPSRVGRAFLWSVVSILLAFFATDAFATGPSDREQTRIAIGASAYSVGEHYRTTHALPDSLAHVRQRRRDWDMTRDAWGHPLVYRKDGADAFRLASLGADGVIGGSGDDADVEVAYRIGATGREEEVRVADDRRP